MLIKSDLKLKIVEKEINPITSRGVGPNETIRKRRHVETLLPSQTTKD